MNTLLDPRELIESAMIDLGLEPDGRSKPAMLKEFGEFLVNERSAGRLVLLVIDEAQNLSLPALEEIRMISNLETEKSKLLQIVLVGQPDLRDKLDRPELEQLRQRITVSYHLEALDADETWQYINHRLARAALGTPMEFPREVTDRIHARSGGVPRLINVIADATLVFGYGEERSEVDRALIDEVITDLDATGVLGPRSNPNRHESVVPPTAPIAAAEVRQESVRPAPSAAADRARTAEDDKLRRELADLERSLKKREHDMTLRERELAEQRRVLADQFRLLKTQTQPQTAGAAAWPPTDGSKSPVARSAHQVHAPAFAPYAAKRRSSLWRRVKNTLLGTPERILEDSL
jgi:hypothetical protein